MSGRCALALIWVVVMALGVLPVQATTVRFDTVLGDIDVQLFDTATPQTVANFLDYVVGCDYTNTMFHRAVSGFVLQGGGFTYDGTPQANPNNFPSVTARPPVQNEPGISNVRGTIAMAKLSGNPDSATNQWFFNLGDNSANLDNQNGGFTVFGQVLGNGMDVVDAIAALPTSNFGGAFTNVPLRNFTAGDLVDDSNLALIRSIHMISDDAAASILSTLDMAALNTALSAPASPTTTAAAAPDPVQPVPEPGTLALLSLISLTLLRRRRSV